jgi:N-acetylglucosaminyl-diphospho-decaprenol L-rhamnosyltransferase
MQLSIIIVNWNSAQYARDCVASIRRLTRNLSYEILVVDNASTDNSAEALSEIPDIHLICSRVNLGFAGANNLGFTRSQGDAVLFLNPDTLLLSPAINQMYEYLELQPAVGAVGCCQLNADLTFQTASVHAFPTIANQVADNDWLRRIAPRAWLWGRNAPVTNGGFRAVEVEAVSGACLMARRAVLNQVGGFSTDYFMYGDDIDLCYRIAAHGWKIRHLPGARIVHYGGKSSEQAAENCFADVLTRESVRTFFFNTRGPAYAFAYRISMGVSSLLRLALLGPAYLASPSQHRKAMLARARRWIRVWRWAVGLERWTRALPRTAAGSAESCPSILPDASS